MVKPIERNTLCMIRGILPQSRGHDCNGMIVTAIGPEVIVGKQAWYIEPVIHSKDGLFQGVLEENLFPLLDPQDDELDNYYTKELVHD